jgi:hypothetical protein
MKKATLLLILIILCSYLSACTQENVAAKSPDRTYSPVASQNTSTQSASATAQPSLDKAAADDKAEVKSLVEEFGSKLKDVSLLAPKDILESSMKESYGDLVAPELLNKWLSDPTNAPGRLTSSPWPDRIEIKDIEKISDSEYKVNGEIVEITSTERPGTGAAARRQVIITVKKIENRWVISDVVLGAYLDT